MKEDKIIAKYTPLTHTTYYILLALTEPLHGYGIMQKVEEMSKREVRLGPGTLYGSLGKLEKDQLIMKSELQTNERRKSYEITALGKMIIQKEYQRLVSLVSNSKPILENLEEISDEKEGV